MLLLRNILNFMEFRYDGDILLKSEFTLLTNETGKGKYIIVSTFPKE